MKNVFIQFNDVYLNETSVVSEENEAKNFGQYFDYVYKKGTLEENNEENELQILKTCLALLFKKSNIYNPDIVFGGDLTNQISISSMIATEIDSSFIGIYSACSTLILAMILGSIFVSNQLVNNSLCFTSSSYRTAERQFRYPLEYGGQKKHTTTLTTSGAVGCYVSKRKSTIKIVSCTIGKIENIGWKDTNDLGTPMSYAAYTSIKSHFENSNKNYDDYDLIVTGDLSLLGSKMLIDLFKYEDIELNNHFDCGENIFIKDNKHFCGGSGCACIGLLSFSYIKEMIEKGMYTRVLLVGTGSLHSKTSSEQNEIVPVVAHVLELEKNNDIC